MTTDLEDLKRRLVLRHKADGRSVYDEAAKAELVALCVQSGASVSRLARDCGINANQLSRWLREGGHGGRARAAGAQARPTLPAFVAVTMPTMPAASVRDGDDNPATMTLQARLPNGVSIELRGLGPSSIAAAIEALGSVRCSASTTV